MNEADNTKKALELGLWVIEVKRRNQNKDLGPWEFVAAFAERDDAFMFYGRYHQNKTTRVVEPTNKPKS